MKAGVLEIYKFQIVQSERLSNGSERVPGRGKRSTVVVRCLWVVVGKPKKAETVVLEVGSRILPASMLRVLLEARRVTGLGGLGRGGQDSRGADRGFVHLLRVGGVEEKRCLG